MFKNHCFSKEIWGFKLKLQRNHQPVLTLALITRTCILTRRNMTQIVRPTKMYGIQGQLPLIATRVNSFLVLSSLKSKMCKCFQHDLLIFERDHNEIYRSIIKTLRWLEIFAKKCYPCLYFGIL